MAFYLTSVALSSTKNLPGGPANLPKEASPAEEEALLFDLDDHDPATTFDLVLRTKIKNQLDLFENEIVKAGHPKGSDKYLELMALSIFVWDYAQEKSLPPGGAKIKNEHCQELIAAGLDKIVRHIQNNGGLGSAYLDKDCGESLPALRLFEKKCGNKCFPKTERLYALYKHAGLPVIPIAAKYKNSSKKHVAILLHLSSGETRIFDPLYLNAATGNFFKKVFRWQAPITEKDFLGIYHYHQGTYCEDRQEYANAIEAYKKAINLSADQSYIYYNLGRVYLQKGRIEEIEEAISCFKKSIASDPKEIEPHISLGIAYYQKNLLKEAEEELKTAIKLSVEQKNGDLKSLAEKHLKNVNVQGSYKKGCAPKQNCPA